MRTALVFGFSFFVALAFGQDSDSLEVAGQVDSLLKISRDLTDKKDFDKALEVNAVVEKIALERFGRESAAYGGVCFNRGRVLFFKGEYAEAENWYTEAKVIREKALGTLHSDYVSCITNLAILYEATGNTEQAEAHYTEAVTLHEKIGGKQKESYASSLSQLANFYCHFGQYDKALSLLLEAASIWEQHLDKSSQTYFWILNNLGNIYSDLGQFKEARRIHLDLKDHRKQVLGEEHPDFVASLRNLASVDKELGYFEEAEQLYLQAKDIHARIAGKDIEYASILSSLGLLYDQTYKFHTAEQLYLEARSIIISTLGKNHEKYYGLLVNMGLLYHSVNPRKAESLYLEARDYFEQLGKEHRGYMYCQNNLGVLYADLGEWEKSEACHREILALRSKLLGKSHPYYAYSLGNLAFLYIQKEQFDKAEETYLEAQTIFLNALGTENLDYTNGVHALGMLYNMQNELQKAEFCLSQLLQLSGRIQGKDSKAYADVLILIGEVYEKQKRHAAADSSFLEASPIRFSDLLKAASIYSEVELATYTKSFEKENAKLLDLLGARVFKHSHVGSLPGVAFDNVLFYKGFLLSAATRINQVNTSDPAIAQANILLKTSRRQLAVEYTKPKAERDSMYIVELEENAAQAEKQLAKQVAGYAGAIQQANWQQVLANLKPEEAAMEFVHFRLHDKKPTDSTLYAALLLRHGAEQPVFVPLFEEKSLDSLLYARGERKADYVNGLYTLADRSARPLGKPQKTLYDLLWKPLEKELVGVQTIHFSPSGLLHRLNLAAIPISLDSVLSDRYHLVELGSTRQLVIPSVVIPPGNDAVLFGGIAYEADSTAMSQANAGLDSVSIASRGALSFSYTDSTLRVGTWNALPFTDREVGSVEKTLKTVGFQSDTRRGFAATEEAFKTLGAGGRSSPRVLHIATHGFFFPDPEKTSARFETSPTFAAAEPVFKMSDHPMIRSGLILAGGNHAWATGKPLRPGMEDGILTAYEISQMNLANTELVVLSACETGLGDIQGNEGVYGLQRAFKIAGAKYLIMSLWQVPDRETSVFMTTFYKHWLESKMSIPDAFRVTQQEMHERFINPYQWAGFVLVE